MHRKGPQGQAGTCLQVLHPQVLTLAVMVVAVVLTAAPGWSGNAVIWLSLTSQAILGLTNATITGGIMAMASWLPPPYVQVPCPALPCAWLCQAPQPS